MTDTKHTQCPHCQATFKVTDDQLKMAGGKVRCGACMNIFNALEYTLEKEAKPKEKINTSVESKDYASYLDTSDDPIDLESELTEDMEEMISEAEKELEFEAASKANQKPIQQAPSRPEEEEEELLFEDNPEEDELDGQYKGSRTVTDEFSTDFLNLDKDEALLGDDPFKTGFQEQPESDVDESWTEDILETETTKSNHTSESQSQFDSEGLFAEPEDHFQQRKRESASEVNRDPVDELSESLESQAFSYQNLSIPTIEEEVKKKRPLVSASFFVANLILLVALLGQASWFHYDKLAHIEALKPAYQKACEILKCTLPTLSDVSLIRSQNLVVRSHPTLKDALIIDAIIVNDARYAQPFPQIGIYFSDINENVVAQRLITPKEYLAGDLLSWKAMPTERQIRIALEIVDPGKHAVNYSIRFYEKKTS